MANVTLLVKAGVLVTAHDKPAIRDGAVAISGQTVESVGTFKELSNRYPGARQIGGKEFLVIPGLINAHSHGRGLTDFQRGALDNTIESWLLDTRKYIPVSTYDDVAFSAARLLKSGVTTTMHNHILKAPSAYVSEFDDALQAYSDAGLRVQFNPSIKNDNPFVYGNNEAFLATLPQDLRDSLSAPLPQGSLTGDNFVKAVLELHGRADSPMSRIGFGPLAPQWCTKELLQDIHREATRLGRPVHIHALQSIFQKIYGVRYLGKTLIEYMHDIGILGEGLVIGHCVWPTESDIKLLSETGTGVTHHPSCNLRVRNGISPVFHMLRSGVLVGLGMDGKSINDDDDFIQEMKICFLLHRIPSLELESSYLTGREVFKIATENGAKLLGYGEDIGRIEPGRFADLALLDYDKMCYPFVDPSQDPIDTLMYRGVGRHVHTVVVNGRIVLQNGQLLTLDEEAIAARLAKAAFRPRTDSEKALVETMNSLQKHVVQYYSGWTKEVDMKPYFYINSRVNGV